MEQIAEEIIDDIIALSKAEGRVMPGVISLLKNLKTKGYKLGVATSSPARMLHELIDFFELKSFFIELSSADTVGYGKPVSYTHLKDFKKMVSKDAKMLKDKAAELEGMVEGKFESVSSSLKEKANALLQMNSDHVTK